MRILIITQGMSRIVYKLFESKYQVIGVLESMPRDFELKNNSLIFFLLKKIYAFIKRDYISLSDFCKLNETPYNIISKKNVKEVSMWVQGLNPDLIVIYSMSQLLSDEIIKIPYFGVINLHSSFLSDYRGPNPDFWQYYFVEMNPGVTVHYVNTGEDTGDIIFQERVYIPLGTKSKERLDILIGKLGISLLIKAIEAIRKGNPPRLRQPKNSATIRARNLGLEEHDQIINWHDWPIERIWHVLRGTEGWLNAIRQPTGLFAGQRWSVREYEKIEISLGVPGQVGKYKSRKCIFLKDGIIYIEIIFDLKKTILKIFGSN
jgi:methionyl-tRNA formyltransferase